MLRQALVDFFKGLVTLGVDVQRTFKPQHVVDPVGVCLNLRRAVRVVEHVR